MSFIIAAPSSGSGKTTITLGLLRALHRRGIDVRGAKSGPDYIDPAFHAAACARPCLNLDAWAMTPEHIRYLAQQPEFQIIEGAMGLFDGAPPIGKGATADLAHILELPVVLVVDAASMAQSIGPLVNGFARHNPFVEIAGVILNKVGSPRHEQMLRDALEAQSVKVFGAVHRADAITRPSRHLGLVQAGEMPDLNAFLDAAADIMEDSLDMDALMALDQTPKAPESTPSFTKANRTIAIASDIAFAFHYAHHDLAAQEAGITIKRFSPIANELVPEADEIFLPGGYPELHAERIASSITFLTSLKAAAKTTPVYGECGGYMVLGEVLTDADGAEHNMAGLLPLHTSFADRKLHLGYRTLTNRSTGIVSNAHEFHYASTIRADGASLFDAQDAEGNQLAPMGLIEGNVTGSFAHIIS